MIINIQKLRIDTIIGLYQIEKQAPQTIYVNIKIEYDAGKATTSDQIEDAVDYHPLCDGIVKLLKDNQYTLLEKAITEIGKFTMAYSERFASAVVEIEKPQAPIAGLQCIGLIETFYRN